MGRISQRKRSRRVTIKKYHAVRNEMKKGRPVFGFLMGKRIVESATTTAGTLPDFPLQENVHSGFRALTPTPHDFDEAGVDDLFNAAKRSRVSK